MYICMHEYDVYVCFYMSVRICLPVYMSVSAYLFSRASVNVHM